MKQKARRPEVKKCPLKVRGNGCSVDCDREKCAWWDSGRCAVVSIASALWRLNVVEEQKA